MKIIKSIIAAFSTFSKIPMPTSGLTEEDFRYTLCFFPLVGAVVALLEWCVWKICGFADLNIIFRICVMCAVPIIVTGGIHMDGFCDTSDALSSYQPTEKKLEILKDPHIGAFGVIRLIAQTLLYVAAVSQIENVCLFGLTFVLSRVTSAFSVVTLKSAKKTGMGATEKTSSNKFAVYISSVCWILICIFTAFIFSGISGIITALCMVAACVIMYTIYAKKVYRNFGGFTGDTSGWLLCVLECVLAYVCVACGILL
jgi:adenosylcobinamide-GDP ribazoletransferase